MKTFDVSFRRGLLALVAACAAHPAFATEMVVVSAVGVVEPAGLEAGQPLAAGTRLRLERWGRAVVRETAKCALTHVVVGLEEHVLELSDDCSRHQDPLTVAARVQQGDAFVERVKEAESGTAGDLVAALALNPCVFMERLSEEGNNSRQCPSGYALRGLRCSGSFCDDKDLMCCPYLDGAPDATFKEAQARQISEEFPSSMTSKRFLNGMTCWGPYCDNVLPHAFKSSRLVNARTCDWTAWSSAGPGAWLDCGEGRFAAGMRCQGEYCADVALHCCQARVE